MCYSVLEVKIMKNIFNPDSPLMITMSQISDCIFLSLLWLLCCFPVITCGASCAALYDSVFRSFREDEKYSWGRFFKSFKSNFKSSLLPTVLFIALASLIVKAAVAAWNGAVLGSISWMLFAGAALLLCLALGILGLMFPVLSRFENSFFGLVKNTLFLGLANLPRSLVLGLAYAASAFLCLRFIVPLFFLPALITLISTVLIEPMFRPFMPAEVEDT